MARTGTKPTATKVNYVTLPGVPATQKNTAAEFNWLVDKSQNPYNQVAFNPSVKADDEYSFADYTQTAQIDFVKDGSVVDNQGAGNGLTGVIIANGDPITFTSDFDVSYPSSYIPGIRYMFDIVWRGLKFKVKIKKVGEDTGGSGSGVTQSQYSWLWSDAVSGGGDTYQDFIIAGAVSGEIFSADSCILFIGGTIQTENYTIVTTNTANDTVRVSAASGEAAPTDEVNLFYNKTSVTGIPEAPIDGNQYARKDAGWVQVAASGGGGLENRYADIAAMIADQANQNDKGLQFVTDASADTTVDSGYAYYEYLGTTVGNLTDYRKLSEQESMDLDLSIYQTKTDNDLTTTSKQIDGAINELDAEIASISGDQVALTIFKYSNTSGAL